MCGINKRRIKEFNRPLPLVDYLVPYTHGKKDIKIADIGSGPYSIIGSYLPGVDLKIYHSDRHDFKEYWEKYNHTPVISVEYQHMENLTYPDGFFDIVHCCNALDHTKKAKEAVKELIRVCKAGGYVYIICNLDQLSTGHKHYWNAKEDGVFTNNVETFDLKDFGFTIHFTDNGGDSRYNFISAVLQKDKN